MIKRHILVKSQFAALVALLAVAACNRLPIPEEQDGDVIRVSARGTDPATKALLNAADIKKAGATVQVYDYLTGFTGNINGTAVNGEEVMYFGDAVKCSADGSDTWNWTSYQWRWTKSGVHHFFGWLTNDGAGLTPEHLWSTTGADNSAFQYNESTKTLIVPAVTFTKDTKQFDFSYSSQIVTADVSNPAFNAANSIELPLNHLFTALAVEVVNNSPDNAYIKEISLEGFKNQRSASISFNTEDLAAPANYSDGTYDSSKPLLPNWPSGATIDATYGTLIPKAVTSAGVTTATRYDIIKGTSLSPSDDHNFFLSWPQKKTEFAEAKFNVEYYIDGVKDPENESVLLKKTKSIPLTNLELTSLEPGVKYVLYLEFKDKTINFRLKPLPWDMVYEDLDYSSGTILANSNKQNDGVLWLYYNEGGTWLAGDRDTRSVTMVGNKDIMGRFFILAPTSGQWQVTTYPAEAAQYFTVEPSSGAIDDLVDGDGNFHGDVTFYVKAKPGLVLSSTQELHFNVDIMLNGQWRNANTEFNRKDWRIIREP